MQRRGQAVTSTKYSNWANAASHHGRERHIRKDRMNHDTDDGQQAGRRQTGRALQG